MSARVRVMGGGRGLAVAMVMMASTVACSGGGSSGTRAAPQASAFTPVPLPTARVEPLKGGAAKPLAEVTKGRVAVIDLFASWCEACKEVTKNVELLAEAHRGTELMVVGLDVGEDRGVVERFLEGKTPSYPIYLDPALGVPDALGQRELPAIVVVDREGQVRLVRKNVDSSVLRLIDELLKAPASPAAASSAASASPAASPASPASSASPAAPSASPAAPSASPAAPSASPAAPSP